MRWNDLIEEIMKHNNRISSLSSLYKQAPHYRKLPAGDWQKTLRGVLYREVKRGRFKKVGLGVFALPDYEDENSAYSYAIRNIPVSEYLKDIKSHHSTIEGMLLEIGNFFEYRVYTNDINKSFDGKKLKDLCTFSTISDFTYKELKEVVSKSDIIWFNKSKLPFPKFIFEVESTTDFTISMFKMYQLLDFNIKFLLVALEERKKTFLNRLSREPFVSVKDRFSFRSFEDVIKLYFSSVEHYELKSKFLS